MGSCLQNIHCWDPYNIHHRYLPQQPNHNLQHEGKLQVQGWLQREGYRGTQAGDMVVLLPIPTQSTASPHQQEVSSSQLVFLVLSAVRTASSSQTQSWQRRGRVDSVVGAHHFKNNRASCKYGSRPARVSLMAMGCAWDCLCGCLHASFCCLVQIHFACAAGLNPCCANASLQLLLSWLPASNWDHLPF